MLPARLVPALTAIFLLAAAPHDQRAADGPRDPAASKPAADTAVSRALPGLLPAPHPYPGVGRWQLACKIPRGRIYAVAWSPDGRKLAYTEQNTIRICDAQTFKTERFLVGHSQRVTSIDWNRAANRIASASFDGTLRIWSPEGVTERVLKGHAGTVNGVAWSPDGRRLASVGADGSLRITKADGSPERVITAADAAINCVAWDPSGSHLITGDDTNRVKLWRGDGSLERTCEGHLARVTSVAWSPDGKFFASSTNGFKQQEGERYETADVRTWHADGSAAGSYVSSGAIFCVRCSPDGKWAATVNEQAKLRLISPAGELERESQLPSLGGSTFEPSLAWRPDGKEIAVGGTGGICIVEAAEPTSIGRSSSSPVSERFGDNDLLMGPDRAHVVVKVIGQEQLRSCDLLSGKTTEVPADVLRAAADGNESRFSRDGRRLLFVVDGARLSVWDSATGDTNTIARSEKKILAAAWSPVEDRIAYCDDADKVHVVKVDGRPVVDLAPKQPAQAQQPQLELKWTDDGKSVILHRQSTAELRPLDGSASATFDFGRPYSQLWISARLRKAGAWSTDSAKENFTCCADGDSAKAIAEMPRDIECGDFDRDIARLLLGRDSGDWEMRRLDNPSSEPQQVRAHANGSCMAAVFSPDGRRFATGGWDALVKIWDADGTLERTLWGNTDPIYKLWWTRDGSHLVSSSRNGTFCRWSLDDGRLETMTIVTDSGKLLHIPPDGVFPAADAELAAQEFLVLVEKPNGSIEILEYPEFMKRARRD